MTDRLLQHTMWRHRGNPAVWMNNKNHIRGDFWRIGNEFFVVDVANGYVAYLLKVQGKPNTCDYVLNPDDVDHWMSLPPKGWNDVNDPKYVRRLWFQTTYAQPGQHP